VLYIENMSSDTEQLHAKIATLEAEIEQLKTRLKSYTQPQRNKKYYENNKEEIMKRVKEYRETISPEKKKEYARRAYLNKKERLSKLKESEPIESPGMPTEDI
jgi:outer membrane murein-binding lipoprotein Lpp